MFVSLPVGLECDLSLCAFHSFPFPNLERDIQNQQQPLPEDPPPGGLL